MVSVQKFDACQNFSDVCHGDSLRPDLLSGYKVSANTETYHALHHQIYLSSLATGEIMLSKSFPKHLSLSHFH